MLKRISLDRILKNIFFVGILVATFLALAYLIFEFGRLEANFNILDVKKEKQIFLNRIHGLENEILLLERQLLSINIERKVDQEEYRNLILELETLQKKIHEQRAEIVFYQGIVSPSEGKKGLRLKDFSLVRGNTDREYKVRLVLMQIMPHDGEVFGEVDISLHGSKNGEEVTYNIDELMVDSPHRGWMFSFKFYQDFGGLLILPEGFLPKILNVKLIPKSKKLEMIEKSFDWSEILT